ncbi:MAG: V-type ATP synthase subunit E family protein [Phycisphaerae bacterium]|nr:V-type ATP synthase subunit E family protein [Phycisphaerae bacterium]
MEAEQVIEKILADARAEAEKIKKQADEKEAAEQAKFNEQLDEHKKQTNALAKKLGSEKKLHLLAAARMDIAKEHLAEKSRILDEVFDQARRQLQNLSDDQYKTLCTNLMLEAVETGDEEVIIDTNEKRIDEKFIRQINQKLGPERRGNLKLSDQRQTIGAGFILKRGKIKNNVSLNVLLAQTRKELEIDLAKDLFS